jgi:alginate O-acetyltransferase complex protein AlgJ
MGLLARYRRPWSVIIVALLAVPMLVQAMQTPQVVSEGEARVLSPAPAWPRSLTQWRAWPRDAERYLADHFGLRDELVHVRAIIRFALDALPIESPVIIGREQQLFFNKDDTIGQSTGHVMRTAEIAAFADGAAQLQARLRGADARLLVAIPPNSATILRARLPAWAGDQLRVTEYDATMAVLAQRAVAAVDLRPPLLAANSIWPVYRRTDTHWNKLGALIAYNAVVQALGRPDWTIDPRRVLRGFETVPSGDLARLLAVSALLDDEDARIDLSPYAPVPLKVSRLDTHFENGADLVETGRDGPTVLVIGDSFTDQSHGWQGYFGLHAGRYLWIHHAGCRFARAWLDHYSPDIVILAPTERYIVGWPCANRPQ